MTLIELFSGYGIITFLILSLIVLFKGRWVPAAIPLIAIGWFAVYTQAPNYVGYAVPQEFVDGREAIILAVNKTPDEIYFLVRFKEDNQPRLVVVPSNEKNDKAADEANKKSKEGVAVIRFGRKPMTGERGDHNGSQEDDTFQMIDLSQSAIFAKQD